MTKLVNQIALVIGDASGDGHGRTMDQIINTNLSSREIREAYQIGTGVIGFDFVEQMDKNDITYEQQIAMLKANGWEGDTIESTEEYRLTFLWVVAKGNPEFEYEYANNIPKVYLGGYDFC